MKTLLLHCVPLVAAFAFLPCSATAQNNQLPRIDCFPVSDSKYEGNDGERRLLRFNVVLSRGGMTEERFQSYLRNNTVSFLVSTVEGNGGFETGVATKNTDFVEFRNFPMTISTPPTASASPVSSAFFTVTFIGDGAVENREAFAVELSNIVGARISGAGNRLVVPAFIDDDDRVPTFTIGDISASEPIGRTTRVNFTATLAYPFPRPVILDFATRDGTASSTGLFAFRDYTGTSGSLEIPANTLTGVIGVTLNADTLENREPTERFFLDVRGREQSGGAGFVPGIWQATGICRILDRSALALTLLRDLVVGDFQFGPDKIQMEAGKEQKFGLTWAVPEGKVWRNLRSIDVRVRERKRPILWLRWDEATNQFALVEGSAASGGKKSKLPDVPSNGTPVGAPASPGTETELSTDSAKIHLAGCKVTGSGPAGVTAALDLALSFNDAKRRRLLTVEIAATDDSGNEDPFVRAGVLMVKPPKRGSK